MFTRIRSIMLIAALAIVSFVAANTTAQAQLCHCTIVNGCKVLTYYDSLGNVTGSETICPSSGNGNFNCQQLENPPAGPLNVSLPAISIDAISHSPTLGPIHTRLDPSRPATPATIISNNPPARFPATGRISWYAIANIQGIEYCSRTELVFVSKELHSFLPFQHERFCLEDRVEFYRCGDPDQRTVFALEPGNTAANSTCVYLN